MDSNQKQKILIYLSKWIQISRFGERKNELILEGYPLKDFNEKALVAESEGLIRTIEPIAAGNHRKRYLVRTTSKKRFPTINIVLFLITVLTTLVAGAIMENENPFVVPLSITAGIPFSVTLLLILGVHELGHYYFARKHKVEATLPFFIPAPTLIGTFGAFIKMRSPVRKRKALVEIGAAGPIAGFLVALPALFIGMLQSKIITPYREGGIQLGDSLITKLVALLVYPDLAQNEEILLSSVGFAAWIGMLVTMLNLLPIGQLDGGHIAYALLGKWHSKIAKGAFIIVLLLGTVPLFFGQETYNWLVWAALVFFLIKIKHPPILDSRTTITTKEKLIGVTALLIFILTFIPVPFRI